MSSAIVVAFERKYVASGQEKRGANIPDEDSKTLTDVRLTTPWNHMEGAMAYGLGMPILILAENGLHPEGVLEPGIAYIQNVPMSVAAFGNDEVRNRIKRWCSTLGSTVSTKKSSNKEVVLSEQTKLGELFSALSLKLSASLFAIVAAVFMARVTAGTFIQSLKSPLGSQQSGQVINRPGGAADAQ